MIQKTIKHTTTQFLASLSQELVYYTSEDFKNAGFPDYLISRVLLEVERNLADSISLPESDWVDLKADSVQEAWDQFLSAIRAESRVPASFAQSVIESSVEDVLDQLTQPRQYILDTLIGEKSATLFQVQGRKTWIVAVPVLADALIRYMQRKNLDTITRVKSYEVIAHVDDKLTENYTPLKWAQHLDPVFSLLNNEVPSTLFVRFFRDRGMTNFALWIDKGPEILSRTAFIERISTVGMLPEFEEEEYIDGTPEIEVAPSLASTFEGAPEEDETAREIEETASNNETDEAIDESAENTESISLADAFTQDANDQSDELEVFQEPSTEEEAPFQVDDEPKTESDSPTIAEQVSLDEVLAEEDAEIPLFARFLNEEVEEQETQTEEAQEEYPLSELEPENVSSIEAQFNSKHDEPEDDPEDTHPIIDASSDDEHVIYLTDRAKQLLDLLEPNFETYVVEIFLNDELALYKHLENIVAYDQWRSAGRYITKDIFDRNRIDLYSEPAVMFTDAVQEFFDQFA